jgi:hypothetical protein
MTGPFYFGAFDNSSGFAWMEWDGNNEGDITEWLNSRATPNLPNTWTYVINDGQLIFTGEPYAGQQPPASVGDCVALMVYAHGSSISIMPPEAATRYWRTPDPTGRPVELNDLLGSSPDADVE